MRPAIGPWAGRKYFLDKMTLRDLVVAYFTYYGILVYLLLAAVGITLAVTLAEGWARPALAAAVVVLLYPAVWYALHRWVLHGQWLYRIPWTAAVWKRIHYDHHQDPHDLSVLFGALYTTLPTIAIVTIPLGWAIAGPAGAAAATASGILTTCFYEFCHCIQHLPFQPRWEWLRQVKKLHLAHHFHSEKGNFGITNFFLGSHDEHLLPASAVSAAQRDGVQPRLHRREGRPLPVGGGSLRWRPPADRRSASCP